MTNSEISYYASRIDNASSREELLAILREMRDRFGESDPDVKVLEKKRTL